MASPLPMILPACVTALAALCMSMGRHQGAVFGARCPGRRTVALRGAGWGALALSFALATAIDGPAFGPVHWLGALTAAALLVVGLLSYRPAWLGPAFAASLCATVLACAAAWWP